MIEDEHRSVRHPLPCCPFIQGATHGRIRGLAGSDEGRIHRRVAIAHTVEKPIRGDPEGDIAVRVGAARPDAEGHIVAAAVGTRDHGRGFKRFDPHLKARLGHHGLHDLGDLGLDGAVGREQREDRVRLPCLPQQSARAGHVAGWWRK